MIEHHLNYLGLGLIFDLSLSLCIPRTVFQTTETGNYFNLPELKLPSSNEVLKKGKEIFGLGQSTGLIDDLSYWSILLH